MTARDEFDVATLRQPPWSQHAEQAVLGALFLDNAAWDRCADVVRAEDFYAHGHRVVFEAIGGLITACKPADVVTVFERLKAMGKVDEAGGLAMLNALAECAPGTANVRRHAEIVAEKALRRALIALCDEAATQAFGSTEETPAVLDRISSAVAQLERRRMRKAPKSLGELLPGRLDHINALHAGEGKGGTPTGVDRLDRLLAGGLRPGQVYILAARPSVGKSALAQAIGEHVAGNEGPALMLSQEMPDTEVADRALARLGGISYEAIQTGRLADGDWSKLASAVDYGARLPFYVDDQPALRLADIRAKARQVKGLRLLIIDYLQLSVGDGENRTQEVGAISRGIKSLAKELGVPVLLLSQLSRKVEERPGREPQLSDLRDSGEIEQDADVVIFLWPKHEPEYGPKVVGCKLEKNRQGKKGPAARFGLCFDGARQTWSESEADIDAAIPIVRGAQKEL